MEKVLTPLQHPIKGTMMVPGDKSISHRAVMFGSLAKGKTVIHHFLTGEDCERTIEIFRQFGVDIKQQGTTVTIKSGGVAGFHEPEEPLYFGNSGTTARLMLGILAALPFHTVVYGDAHLTKRPMDRVVLPLRKMGARIDGRQEGSLLPLAIRGQKLIGMDYEMPVKSAQVKSCLLLAGLFADGQTTIEEQATTRDHTENMLRAFGAPVEQEGKRVSVRTCTDLQAVDMTVPGDISSAAFFLTAAAIVPDSHLTLQNVGLNPTRTGILDVLEQMGAEIHYSNEQEVHGEKTGDITISYRELQPVDISGDLIPKLIDELPLVALLATQANGTSVIKDAEELRVKETDRIAAVVELLTTLGAKLEERGDGMVIYGKTPLSGGSINSYNDHRMAMMGAIASFVAEENVIIDDISPVSISYPGFFEQVSCIIDK